MAEPFLAEIRMVGFNFAPRGWALCDGQILPINQNQSLYSLLGTTYGGDGRTSFGLPDLRGRSPIHEGDTGGLSPRALGSKGGEENHTLIVPEIPSHNHTVRGSTDPGTATIPNPSTVLAAAGSNVYRNVTNPVTLNPAGYLSAGGGQGHENMQPYLAVNFCIALQGLFPSRN